MLPGLSGAIGQQGGSAINIVRRLNLTSGLQLVLDAGDAASYNPAVQTDKWLDTSGNGYDFFRGTVTGADAFEPTFNGTAGQVSSGEYFGHENDWFTYDSANETWMNNLHKDNALFTYAFWIYRSAQPVANRVIFGTSALGTTSVGIDFRANGAANTHQLVVRDGTAPVSLNKALHDVGSATGWIFLAGSLNEAADVLLTNTSGVEASTTCAYSGPSALDATFTMEIGSGGNAGTQAMATDVNRLAIVAFWDRALSAGEMQSFYQATRGRFGV